MSPHERLFEQITLLEAELADGTFVTSEARQQAEGFLNGLRAALYLLDAAD